MLPPWVHDAYMHFSLAGISLSSAFLVAVISNYDPYDPNPCITTGADNKDTNYRLSSAYTFATAVIALFGLRLKRIKLENIDGEGNTVPGVFGGKIKANHRLSWLPDYFDAQNLNRGFEFVFHVIAFIAGISFLASNGGSLTSEKCDGDFNSRFLIAGLSAYYLSFFVEVLDGFFASPVADSTGPHVGFKNMLNNWIASLATLGLFGIAALSFLRLGRAHNTGLHVQCKHDASVITFTLAATVLGFISMVTIRTDEGEKGRSMTEQFTQNTYGWGFSMLTLALLFTSYSYKDQVHFYDATPVNITSNHTINLITVPAAELSSTLCAYIKDNKWAKDETSNDYLYYQLILVCVFGAGWFIVTTIFVIYGTGTTHRQKAAAVVQAADATDDDDDGGRVIVAGGGGGYNALARPKRNASDGLARNRLTGDGKKPYTSVSTLQFV